MKFKINLKPYPGAHYFTIREYQRSIDDPTADLPNIDFNMLEQQIRSLYTIPSAFKITLLTPEKKRQWFEKVKGDIQLIIKDDPETGAENLVDFNQNSGKPSLLDLSYSFPHLIQNYSNFDYLVIDPNASLGIPVDLLLLFYRTDSSELMDAFDEFAGAEYQEQIYLLHQVISDYLSKGTEMLVRESNYKAVVLHQVIEKSSFLKPIADKNSRSKTMISAECETFFLENIEKLGYEVEVYTKDGKSYLTIANYPTHSKETIEMFSDRILNA